MSKKTDKSELTFEQLSDARELTDRLSAHLKSRVESYLVTLRPLLSPQRLLGSHSGRTRVGGSTQAVKKLRESFKEACGKPFSLRSQLDDDVLDAVENRLVLYPWEYACEVSSGQESKSITINSPVRWVLTYQSDYSLPRFRKVMQGKEERRNDEVRQFLVNALTMNLVFESFPSIASLLAELRFPVKARLADDLGKLPLLTLDACLPSFLPPDELIIKTSQFSGVPAFIELIDVEAMGSIEDLLKLELEEIIQGKG
jgi:hypothetical protein